jgi:hypothetical protein
MGAGLAGGFAGGVVFGVLMQVTGMIPAVAQLVDQESIVVGWTVHMGIAMFIGTTYALLFGLPALAPSISMVLGTFYGLVWWVFGGLTLMPLRLGMGLFVLDTAAWQSLAGHAAYGFVLGVVFSVAAVLLIREPEPEPEPEPAPPPAPAQPARLSLLSEVPPPVSAPPAAPPSRAGLTPLPRQARELRQHRRVDGPWQL